MNSKPKPIKADKSEKKHKRKKKSARQLLEIELDRIVREIVLLRDKNCVCPAPKSGHGIIMQPGHLITRGRESVKWDLRNVNCQCGSCNLLHEFNPERYTNWFLANYGQAEYSKLVADSEEVARYSLDDLTELLRQMTNIHNRQLVDRTFKPHFAQASILSGEWRYFEMVMPVDLKLMEMKNEHSIID